MPPTQFSSGKVNMNQPYEFGQSGTDRPEPVLVTSPPAKMRTAVDAAVSSAKRWSGIAASSSYPLKVKATSFDSLAPIVTLAVLVPNFSCQASIVYVPGGSPLSWNDPSAPVTAK